MPPTDTPPAGMTPDNPAWFILAGLILLLVMQRHRLYSLVGRLTRGRPFPWPRPRRYRQVLPMQTRQNPDPVVLVQAPALPARRAVPAPLATVPDAAPALAAPPSFEQTVRFMRRNDPQGRYLFPVGWYAEQARPILVWGSFVEDVNHVAVSGKTDSGKDGVLREIALALAYLHPPEEVRFAILDGSRGVDWGVWEDRAHTWLYVAHKEGLNASDEKIDRFMDRLDQAMDERADLLRAHGVDKWDQLPSLKRPPLLVILVTELSILQFRLGRKFDSWISARLNDGRKFGVRFVLQTQSFSGGGEYRKQISLYVAGHQTSRYDDEPNTGMTTGDLAEAGATPPSRLPPVPKWAGVFTILQGREVQTIRAPYISGAAMRELVAGLPAREGVELAPEELVERLTLPEPARPAEQPAGALAELAQAIPEQLAQPAPGEKITWTPEHATMAAFLAIAALQGKSEADFATIELQTILFPEATRKGQRGSYGQKARRIAREAAPLVQAVLKAVSPQPVVEEEPESAESAAVG